MGIMAISYFRISYHPVRHLAFYCFDLDYFAGSGGGDGGGGGRGISWDDPQLTDRSIFVFIDKA